MMELTQEKIDKALEKAERGEFTKSIIMLPKVWMKWFAINLGVPYSTEIETEYIRYIESQKINTMNGDVEGDND